MNTLFEDNAFIRYDARLKSNKADDKQKKMRIRNGTLKNSSESQNFCNCYDDSNNVLKAKSLQIQQIKRHLFRVNTTNFFMMILTIFLTNIYVANSLNVGGPLPTLYYQPLLIQTGSHKFLSTDDTIAGASYRGKFTITYKYLQLSSSAYYSKLYSLRSLYYDHGTANVVYHFYMAQQSNAATGFVLIFYAEKDLKLNFITYFTVVNYLIVSSQLTKTQQIVILHPYFNWGVFPCDGFNAIKTCTANQITQLPSINYQAFIFMQDQHADPNTSTALKPYYKLDVEIVSQTLVTAKLTAQYLRFNIIGYFILLIDKLLFDWTQKKPIMFQSQTYVHNAITAIQPFTIDFTHNKYLLEQNTFIGFNGFKGNPFHYQINPINLGDTLISGNIYSVGYGLILYAISFYGFTENCPTHPMTLACQPCPVNCIQCDVAVTFHCSQCQKTFTLASDKQSCICLPPLTVVQELCGNFPFQCTSSQLLPNGTATCSFCDVSKKLVVKNNTCACQDGYEFDTAGVCQDFCGDGVIYQSQCDDGNNVSDDGCSKNCLKEIGFQCDTSIAPSICKSEIVLSYSVDKILKKENENLAILYLTIENQIILPFSVLKQNFQPLFSHLTLKIVISQSPYRQIIAEDLELLSIDQNNQIQLYFPFKFTIEGLNGEINLNYENTKYKNETQKLNFILAGDNQGLKFQENVAAYKNLGYSMMGGTFLNIIGLFIGFFTPKFIGLESILTLQLLYYSQLLIAEVSKWPPGFSFLKYVKFAGGYNQVIEITQIMPLSQISKKMSNLSFHKSFIENFNINFIILFIVSIFLLSVAVLRNSAEKQMLQIFQASKAAKAAKTSPSPQNKKSELLSRQMKGKVKKSVVLYSKINEIAFWIGNQVSIWVILPFLFAISYEFMVVNSEYRIVDESNYNFIALKIRGILSFLSLFLILCIGCSKFVNFWLSLSSLNVLMERPEEIIYKRTLFVYLFVVGCLVFFFNSEYIGFAYCSTLVLVIQIIYILALVKIDPYKQSLHVHSVVLLFNNSVYAIFLVVINLINYVEDLNSLIVLVISFFVTGCAGISVILTFVRLYYELRYGKELQDKIMEERKRKKQEQLMKKELLAKKNQKLLQMEAKEKLSQEQKIRNKNPYLYQNQIKQRLQQDYIKFLDRRHLTQKEKQAYYFKQFTQKPLSWMKKHDRQKFLERKRLLQQQQKMRIQKQLQKKNSPQFIAVVQKIQRPFKNRKKTKITGKWDAVEQKAQQT